LFYEDVNDVLRATVQALGGAKRVGAALRGNDIGVDAAGRWVLDCLNPDRRERFTPEQVLWLLARRARSIFMRRCISSRRGRLRAAAAGRSRGRARQAAAPGDRGDRGLKSIAERLERLGVPSRICATSRKAARAE
jgi:hypothetical protein